MLSPSLRIGKGGHEKVAVLTALRAQIHIRSDVIPGRFAALRNDGVHYAQARTIVVRWSRLRLPRRQTP
jgi:hypothetical protein